MANKDSTPRDEALEDAMIVLARVREGLHKCEIDLVRLQELITHRLNKKQENTLGQ